MSNFVTIEGRALVQAMKIANAVIERRNTIPILSHVKLTLNSDGLEIVGTDLDMFVTHRLDVIDGAGEWSTCIPADLLQAIAAAAGVAPVRIEPVEEDGKTSVVYTVKIAVGDNDALYDLQALPASDFPDPTSGQRADLIETFTNGMLADQFRKVSYAISTEETRYYLNGIYWDMSQGECSFVATDGHRLARCRYSKEAPANGKGRIIPRKACDFVLRYLSGKDVKIFDTKGESQIEIVAPGFSLRTKLIDGTYPDYRRVIPKAEQLNYVFAFKRSEIATALSQVGVLARERGRAVRFKSFDGRVSLESNNPDFGTAIVTTQAKWPDRAAPSFGLNLGYAREAAGTCMEDFTMHMVDAGSPFIIKDADEDMTRVLMPMRV